VPSSELLKIQILSSSALVHLDTISPCAIAGALRMSQRNFGLFGFASLSLQGELQVIYSPPIVVNNLFVIL
jgi:hypothetical protein